MDEFEVKNATSEVSLEEKEEIMENVLEEFAEY